MIADSSFLIENTFLDQFRTSKSSYDVVWLRIYMCNITWPTNYTKKQSEFNITGHFPAQTYIWSWYCWLVGRWDLLETVGRTELAWTLRCDLRSVRNVPGEGLEERMPLWRRRGEGTRRMIGTAASGKGDEEAENRRECVNCRSRRNERHRDGN